VPTVNELREARKRAHNEAIVYLTKEKFDAECRSNYDRAMSEVDRLGTEIERAEGNGSIVQSSFRMPDKDHKRAAAFSRWMRGIQLDEAERRSLEFRDVAEGAPMLNHIGSYSGLGFLVPTAFADAIEVATKYYAPLSSGVFGKIETGTGAPLPYPTNNDTAQSAVIVGEAGTINESDVTASHVLFGAYKLTSGVVKASLELLQDSFFDLESFLADAFGVRYGRGLEGYLTNGTGNGTQPTGILTAIEASGATPIIATGSSETSGGSETGVNSIGYSDLVNLEHSVDPSYRQNAKYMFHDLTLSRLKRILDKFGRPIWLPGMAGISSNAQQDTLNGYSYVINQSMQTIGASNTTVVFGDLSKYKVRKVSGFSVQRLSELYAANGQVGFISNMRIDGNLVDAGSHPCNLLMQHS